MQGGLTLQGNMGDVGDCGKFVVWRRWVDDATMNVSFARSRLPRHHIIGKVPIRYAVIQQTIHDLEPATIMKHLILLFTLGVALASCSDHFLGPPAARELGIFFTKNPLNLGYPVVRGVVASASVNGADMKDLSEDSSYISCAPANGKMAYMRV